MAVRNRGLSWPPTLRSLVSSLLVLVLWSPDQLLNICRRKSAVEKVPSKSAVENMPAKICRRKYAGEWPLPQQYQQSHLLWRPWIPASRGRARTQTRWSALTRVEHTAISRLHNNSSNRTRCHLNVDADESPPLAPLKPPLCRVRVWAASEIAPIVANEDAGAIDASSCQLFNHNQQSHVSLLWPMQAVNAAADEPSVGADRPICCSTRQPARRYAAP
jgi:hypothetical protein